MSYLLDASHSSSSLLCVVSCVDVLCGCLCCCVINFDTFVVFGASWPAIFGSPPTCMYYYILQCMVNSQNVLTAVNSG